MAGRKERSGTGTQLSSEYESWLKDIARIGPERTVDSIAIGDQLAGDRFEIISLLGRGGMGSVYEAFDHRDGRSVALKTFHGTRPESLFRLKNEFRALADVRHRNLVKLWELHNDNQRWFFTMELLRGANVDVALCDASNSSIRSALGGLAAGLAALHRRGLIHRDVKPSNVIVLPSGRAVLLDFGIVADITKSNRRDGIAGTRAYMAPEHAAGAEPSAADDLYSLGVVLYEQLTGRLPSAPLRPNQRPKTDDAVLAELCVALLGAPAKRPTASEVAATLGVPVAARIESVPLVGRDVELANFEITLERARAGGANSVLEIRGRAGHGKSALLEAFCGAARENGHAVFASQCREREQVPFNALDSIIDGVALRVLEFADEGRLVQDLEPLARLFPALGIAKRLERTASPPTFHDRQRAFALLADVLSAIANGLPLLLAIDDAQWADRDSFALLSSLLSATSLSLVVVATTTRTQSASEEYRLADRLGMPIIPIELEPLEPGEAEALAFSLVGTDDNASERARRIATQAQGVPLFVCELARNDDSRQTLDSVLRGSIAELDNAAIRALEIVCMAKTVFTREMTARALRGDRDSAFEALDVLERGRLATARRRRGVTTLEPYHQRVRDAVIGSITASDQRVLHHQIASTIAAVNPDDNVGLTYHWRHAGESTRARESALAAAESARSSLAFDRAADLWATALELGEPPTRSLLTARGEALEAAGRGAEAAAAYRQAGKLIESTDVDAARSLERRAAEQLLRAGHVDEGIAAIRGLLADEGMHLPQSSLAALAQLGIERLRLRLRKGRIGHANTLVDVDQLALTWALAVGLSQVDPIRGALYQTRHLRLALTSGDPTRIALGMCAEAMSAASSGPPGTHAFGLLQEAASIGTDSSDPRVAAYLSLANASVSFLVGDFAGARETAATATQLFANCPGARWEQSTADRFHLTCLWHTGRLTELCQRTIEVAAESRALGDLYGLNQLRTTVLPPVRLLADQPDNAEADLKAAWTSLSRRNTFLQHWQHLQASALVHLYRGEPRRALELFEERFVGSGKFFLSRVKAVRVFTSYVRGLAAVGALAQYPGDRGYERMAIRDISQLKSEGPSASTVALIEAQLEYVRGNQDKARPLLIRGIEAARQLDLELIVACAQRFLAKADTVPEAEQQANAFFARHPVVNPDRITRMLMPAFRIESPG